MSVAIVQKQDQPTGRLTYGVVAETLTNSAVHHRGIKVRLTDGTVGRVQHIQDAAGKFPTHVATAVDDEDGTSAAPSRTLQLQDWIQLPSASHASAAAGIDDDAADWACGVCAFQNSGFLSACEMCNAPAPSIGS
ncbi:hypothetical protein AC1031_007251 [Aphanomyces cochlioides]|nr:hypothetical protein AC1031_007251 [Aphanomyces cochlioides]